MPQATRAADFLGAFGVNGHWSHGFERGDQYGDATKSVEALQHLGVDLVRDHIPDAPVEMGRFDTLAAAGAKFDLLVLSSLSPAENVQMMHDFAQRHPGDVVALEGPNEPELVPVGSGGMEGAQAWQAEFFRLANADPLLADVPVYNFSVGSVPPDQSAASADATNIHAYRPDGDQPSVGLGWHLGHAEGANPGKPVVMTETGYSNVHNSEWWQGVDEPSAAKMILNTYLRADAMGVDATYDYQLLDHTPDPAGTDREAHFGLFDVNYQPKDAADAIHNFTSVVGDGAGNSETVAPDALNYTLSGTAPGLASKLLQEANGTFDLVVWAEPDIWDQSTQSPITVQAQPITADLGQTFGTVKVYDPLRGSEPTQVLSNVSQVHLGVTDHPLIIEASGAVAQPASDYAFT